MRTYLQILCLSGIAFIASAQPAAEMSKLLHSFEHYGRLSGAVWVQQGDSLLFADAYGCADFSSMRPNQLESVFNIGSLSKQFTAAAILHLVEDGKVDLHTPINSYLGTYSSKHWQKITVHHLLSHTSGIPSLLQSGQGLDHVFPEEEAIDLAKLIGYFRELDVLSKAGKKYQYNNSGYVLLAAIIETVSGQPYGEFMADHVFRPYGLTATQHGAPSADELSHPHYGYAHQQGQAAPIYHESWLIGAGSIYSTVQDLARWNTLIHSTGFLNADLRELYFAPHEQTHGRNFYAYGWEVLERDGRSYIHHDGTIMGYTCDLLYEPQTRLLSIVLTNQTFEDLALIGKSERFVRETNATLLDLARGQSAEPLPLPRATAPILQKQTFVFADGYEIHLVEKDKEWYVESDSISPLVFAYELPLPLTNPLRHSAKRAAASLTGRKFRKFARECDGTMKTLSYLGVVRLGMNSIMKGMGDWERSVLFEQEGNSARFRLFCENGTVDFIIHYNEDGKIQGIFDTDRSDNSQAKLPLQLKAWPVEGGLFIDGFSFGQADVLLQGKPDGKMVFQQGTRRFESE